MCAFPMTGEDGSYARRTEVTLGAFPEEDGNEILWDGTDTEVGSIATLRMDQDREVTLVMRDYAVPPTATPVPLPTVSLTPGAEAPTATPTQGPTPTVAPTVVVATPGSPGNIQATLNPDGIRITWTEPTNTGSLHLSKPQRCGSVATNPRKMRPVICSGGAGETRLF